MNTTGNFDAGALNTFYGMNSANKSTEKLHLNSRVVVLIIGFWMYDLRFTFLFLIPQIFFMAIMMLYGPPFLFHGSKHWTPPFPTIFTCLESSPLSCPTLYLQINLKWKTLE